MNPDLLSSTLLSLEVGFFSVLVTVPVALLLSTVLYRSKWRFLEVFFLLPLFLPPTVSGFVLLLILSPKHSFGAYLDSAGFEIVFTPMGTTLACVLVSFPLACQSCMVGLSKVQSEYVESSIMLGGDRVVSTLRVVWPQMSGAIMVAGLLVFARTLGEFGASMMVGGNIAGRTQTLPLAVYTYAESGSYGLAGLAAALSALLGIVVYLFLRRAEA